jgi:hypothetical protein
MVNRHLLLALGFSLLLLSATGNVAAAPAPPQGVVNHQTSECGEIPGGDECTACYPTGGWVLLGDGDNVECPAGYAGASPEYACDPIKARHCCTEGHSGAPGDCADLIISHRHDQCAFVKEIEGCKPPREWTRRPNGRKAQSWLCPTGYEWVDDLDCSGETASGAPEETTIPCLGTALVAPALLVLGLAIKRNS